MNFYERKKRDIKVKKILKKILSFILFISVTVDCSHSAAFCSFFFQYQWMKTATWWSTIHIVFISGAYSFKTELSIMSLPQIGQGEGMDFSKDWIFIQSWAKTLLNRLKGFSGIMHIANSKPQVWRPSLMFVSGPIRTNHRSRWVDFFGQFNGKVKSVKGVLQEKFFLANIHKRRILLKQTSELETVHQL